jgi:hypothetical protein
VLKKGEKRKKIYREITAGSRVKNVTGVSTEEVFDEAEDRFWGNCIDAMMDKSLSFSVNEF